jgi:hypothetical protein
MTGNMGGNVGADLDVLLPPDSTPSNSGAAKRSRSKN